MQNTPIFTSNEGTPSEITPAFSGVMSRLAEKVDKFAPYLAAIALIAILFCGILKGLYKPLWFDELFSTFISKLPHASEFWSFAKAVPDGQPPLYYYVVSASMHLFRNDPLGLRMPSTIGYLVFCTSLYIFVRRITSRIYGLVALLLPGITGCWYYLTEGRPYGLILGCTGMAAVSWQSIARGQGRKIGLIGLGASLFGAFCFHYFAVLLFVPFAIAELVRTRTRRRLDLPVWIALAVPFLILIVYAPVVLQTRAHTGSITFPYSTPAWYASLETFGNEFLGPSIVALAVMACVYLASQRLANLRSGRTELGVAFRSMELVPEIALVLSLTCLPLLGIAAGKYGSHNFYPRYVIGAMFGVVSLITLIVWRGFSGRKEAALIAIAVVCAIFAHTVDFDLLLVRDERAVPTRIRMQNRVPKAVRADQLPIVVGGLFDFMELSYYGDPGLLSRICYLSSVEAAQRYYGGTAGERAIIQSAPYFGTHVVDYATWVKSHRNFYLFGGSWVAGQLLKDGAHLQLLQGGPVDAGGRGTDTIFRASLPAE